MNDDPIAREVEELRTSNEQRVAALAAQGMQVQFHGREARVLEFLLDQLVTLLPGAGPARLELERDWERTRASALAEVEPQIRQSVLMQGVHVVAPSGGNGHH